MRKQYYQQSPFLDAIPDAELATRILTLRCQISTIPAHDPTLPRDPRRSSLHGKGHGQPAQHIPYELRYCRLCAPEPNTWGPYTLPGIGVSIGNEEHLIFHCPMLRDTQHNLEQDMQELLYTFRHKYKKHNMPTDWTAIPQDTQLQLILGSVPPAQWGLSLLKSKIWIHSIRNAIDSCIADILAHNTKRRNLIKATYAE
jgi:hypothetical protein